MHKLSLAAVLFATALQAQSPLTTTFANDNGNAVGGGTYFNLTAIAPLTITQVDVNIFSPASTSGTIEMWVRTGTHVGFETSPAGWTRVGTAAVTAAGVGLPTVATFSPPAVLPAGLSGVAISNIGVQQAYTNGTGSNQTYSTAELTLNAGAANNTLFGTAPFTPRVFNGSIYYSIGSGSVARVLLSGTGCNNGFASFYENFAGGTFDLSNGGARCTCNSGTSPTRLTVGPSPATFRTPTSTGLGLTDDSISSQALPFTLNFPCGVTTAAIDVCSNGYLWLGSNLTADFTPTVAELLNAGTPRIAGLWCDLLPDGATNIANVYFDQVSASEVRITWLNVPHFGGTGTTTMQIVLTDNAAGDTVDVLFQTAGHPTSPMIGGYSPGAANRDPGNRDLSATIPATFFVECDIAGLAQNSTRPVMGSTAVLQVSNITAGSLAGVEFLGSLIPGGLPLNGIGMPDCFLYTNPLFLTLPFSTAGSTANTNLPIPSAANLVGLQITVQAVTVTPGANTLGVLSSNAATLELGTI